MVEQNVSIPKILKLVGEVGVYIIVISLMWIISNVFQEQINVKECFVYLGILFDSETIMNRRCFYLELNSPFVVLICIELFIGFFKLRIQYNRVINEIAGCMFAVYLLHSNRIMEEWLEALFPIYKGKNSRLILGYSIIAMVLIHVMSTLVDWIRKKQLNHCG